MIASNALAPVQSYIDSVLSGEIVVCELVRLAVQRHVDDLKRQSTKEFPYHFDVNEASAAIEFFPLTIKHTIGKFADQPFHLEPWQAFGVAMMFGWKRDSDGSRRFRTVYWSMARKNGKSCLAAGVAFKVASFDINPITKSIEQVAEVILCATKKDQADKVIYAEMLRMRKKSKALSSRSDTINKQINFHHNDSYVRTIGSDREYDGLNPQLAVKDEVHALRESHRGFYNAITSGSGSRTQPIDMTITTAGDDKSKIWLEEYGHACAVLRGSVKDETTFAWCFELDKDDDPFDESNWIKANPNLGVSVSLEYLREKKAKATTRLKRKDFIRRQMNRLVSSTEQAFDMELWDKCKGTLSEWKDADAIGGGVDLGGRDDLAAYGMVARFLVEERQPENEGEEPQPVWRYELRAQSYIAEDTERDLTVEPFAEWIHTERIRQCKYPISDLRDDLIDECREHFVSDVAYDPYNGQQFAEEIEQEGVIVASMAQTYAQFAEPISDLLQAIRDGRVTHNGDPVLRWAVSNAVAVRDRADRWMFDKGKSSEKIDPIVAVTMAYRRAMVAPRRASGSLYI